MSNAIKTFLLKHVKQHPQDIVAVTAEHFNVTRTTVHRHLSTLLRENKLIKSGSTRQTKYFLPSMLTYEKNYQISSTLSEFSVYTEDFNFISTSLSENVEDILSYGFTEIFNNAKDHSHGNSINVKIEWKGNNLILIISDNGIGVFRSIHDYFHLTDIRESVVQLSKGKVTTDPSQHTGEGIFFSSRAFNVFEIFANGLCYIRDNNNEDWSFKSLENKTTGTIIRMTLNKDTTVFLTDIFKRYQDEDSLAFTKTDILIQLAQFKEETLMSRSQAKRITFNLEKFEHVTLDFKDIRLVGQGFVDEIFRVYANAHPQIHFEYINANPDVNFMIRRGIETAKRLSGN